VVSLTRPVAPDPYSLLPAVPSFDVTSTDWTHGEPVPVVHTNTDEGRNVSPQVAWSGFPPETSGFAVSVFDPDAPGVAGWFHWTVLGLGADVTSLATGAGSPDGAGLPGGAFQLRNDDGETGYTGCAPPPGDQVHRYFLVVHALDTDDLGVTAEASPAYLGFTLFSHTLARGTIVAEYDVE
jgi:Raf kinase inhibitor-like YbhB/YbcL family protein